MAVTRTTVYQLLTICWISVLAAECNTETKQNTESGQNAKHRVKRGWRVPLPEVGGGEQLQRQARPVDHDIVDEFKWGKRSGSRLLFPWDLQIGKGFGQRRARGEHQLEWNGPDSDFKWGKRSDFRWRKQPNEVSSQLASRLFPIGGYSLVLGRRKRSAKKLSWEKGGPKRLSWEKGGPKKKSWEKRSWERKRGFRHPVVVGGKRFYHPVAGYSKRFYHPIADSKKPETYTDEWQDFADAGSWLKRNDWSNNWGGLRNEGLSSVPGNWRKRDGWSNNWGVLRNGGLSSVSGNWHGDGPDDKRFMNFGKMHKRFMNFGKMDKKFMNFGKMDKKMMNLDKRDKKFMSFGKMDKRAGFGFGKMDRKRFGSKDIGHWGNWVIEDESRKKRYFNNPGEFLSLHARTLRGAAEANKKARAMVLGYRFGKRGSEEHDDGEHHQKHHGRRLLWVGNGAEHTRTNAKRDFARFGKRFTPFGADRSWMAQNLHDWRDAYPGKRFTRFGKRFTRFGKRFGEDHAWLAEHLGGAKRFTRFGKRFTRFGKRSTRTQLKNEKKAEEKKFTRFGKRFPLMKKGFTRMGKSWFDQYPTHELDEDTVYNELALGDREPWEEKRFTRFGKRFSRFGKKFARFGKKFTRFGRGEPQDEGAHRETEQHGEEKAETSNEHKETKPEHHKDETEKEDTKTAEEKSRKKRDLDESAASEYGPRYLHFGKRIKPEIYAEDAYYYPNDFYEFEDPLSPDFGSAKGHAHDAMYGDFAYEPYGDSKLDRLGYLGKRYRLPAGWSV